VTAIVEELRLCKPQSCKLVARKNSALICAAANANARSTNKVNQS
jgi:hypothetical protein